MNAYRCLRCGCLHGWVNHPAVIRVLAERCEPIVAGSLPPGTTGVNHFWHCPRCGFEHANTYGPRPTVEPAVEYIRTRAYFLWEAAGYPPSDSVRFWFAAENALRHEPTFELVRVA